MKASDSQEVWQVDVNGEIYEASFETMTQWIFEGSLLPQDKVRRGNLRWLDAGKIPALTSFFNAKESGEPMPQVHVSSTEGEALPPENPAPVQTFSSINNPPQSANFPPAQTFNQTPIPAQNADVCVIHADAEARYLCDTCGSLLCSACPKGYGGNVKICPMCGSMCSSIKQLQQQQLSSNRYQRDMSEGFGFSDFARALSYPFKYKASLIMGAIMFMFFTLGQSASGSGSFFMMAAAIFCFMLTNMMTFGILANTVENFSQGKIGGNFMPSFDDFSIWDDVVHPFFLSIAAWVVSFGLMIAIIVGAAWYMWNTITGAMKGSMPSLPVAASDLKNMKNGPPQMPPSQAEMWQKMMDESNQRNARIENEIEEAETGSVSVNRQFQKTSANQNSAVNPLRPNREEERFQELQDQMNKARVDSLKASTSDGPDIPGLMSQEVLTNVAKTIGIIIIPVFLALIWGLFYYPAACAVAGYTRSFWATLNPLVGLDTIKRLGFDYVKILFMKLILIIIAAIIAGMLSMILAPFDLPKMGNLPAIAIGSWITFYCSIVFSVILGYALYKNTEKMNLFRG
jgi:hypothetical protein